MNRYAMPDAGVDLSKFEVLPWEYWSTRRITDSNTATSLSFFTYVLSNPHPDISGSTATINDTNLKKERSIETPNKFYLQTISLVVSGISFNTYYSAISDNQFRRILSDAIWEFRIGDTLKAYGQVEDLIHPAQMFHETKLCKGVKYVVKPRPFLLQPENSFGFTINWRTAPTTDSGVNAYLKVVFGGRLLRPVGN